MEKETKQENTQITDNIIGWKDINILAQDVWNSNHFLLLEGSLVFAFRNTGQAASDLVQLVITRSTMNTSDFAVGLLTSGYSMLLPHVPVDYLEQDLRDDMKKWKIKSDILRTYDYIIKTIRDEITSN